MPDHVVNKIAAGEVVERPASVVKELVDNAIDADASRIQVDLRDGGLGLIRVTDDGSGMTAEEVPLAIERHATSKLAIADDLEAIETLGFRGEALAAICAVSRFTLVSRARGAPTGTRVTGEGGSVAPPMEVPAEPGTVVEVGDLFFNTPARLKFLKSPAAELSATLRILTQQALAQPSVQLRVTNNGRAVLTAPAARNLRERIGALWSYELAGRLLELDREEHGVRVVGLASLPDLTRATRDDIVLVVNHRPVRDPSLLQAVLHAYRPLLARDRFPLVVLGIELAALEVDVNVHPTKAWVRFRHPRLVQEMLIAALQEGLRRPVVIPELPVGAGIGGAPVALTGPGEQRALFAETPAAYGPLRFGRVLGQVQDTFVVSASDDEVFFLDQHVAHERVLFDRLHRRLAAGEPPSQALLFPEPLELAPPARALLARWREALEALGFVLDGFGGETVSLRAVPALLKGDEPKRLIEAALEELGGPKAGQPEIDRALAFVACRGAVKANTVLGREEMEALVADLSESDTPFFCPHGRPIVSRVSLTDIRRELRRSW